MALNTASWTLPGSCSISVLLIPTAFASAKSLLDSFRN